MTYEFDCVAGLCPQFPFRDECIDYTDKDATDFMIACQCNNFRVCEWVQRLPTEHAGRAPPPIPLIPQEYCPRCVEDGMY